ncbi:MAG: sigma-70 family RNA polymerase sigma factor [Bacteroidales bacterium]|nr:sigma-70 family RNA polymerase sigma factor [Bacteroidales bacterium]
MQSENDISTVSDFIMKSKEKTINFLLKTFSCLQFDDCEDIFQDAMLVFYEKITHGELDNIKSSLYTYFVGICKFKAMELSRKIRKTGFIDDNLVCGNFSQDKLEQILNLDREDPDIENAKTLAVNEIISDLPDTCAKVFWGYFRDGFSLKTLAMMYGKTESAMKVTKFRCSEKFKNRYREVFNKILGK